MPTPEEMQQTLELWKIAAPVITGVVGATTGFLGVMLGAHFNAKNALRAERLKNLRAEHTERIKSLSDLLAATDTFGARMAVYAAKNHTVHVFKEAGKRAADEARRLDPNDNSTVKKPELVKAALEAAFEARAEAYFATNEMIRCAEAYGRLPQGIESESPWIGVYVKQLRGQCFRVVDDANDDIKKAESGFTDLTETFEIWVRLLREIEQAGLVEDAGAGPVYALYQDPPKRATWFHGIFDEERNAEEEERLTAAALEALAQDQQGEDVEAKHVHLNQSPRSDGSGAA